VQHLEVPVPVMIMVMPVLASRSGTRGWRGLIDEGLLLMDVQTSITCGLMTAFDPIVTRNDLAIEKSIRNSG
jgi:hypothetical protein